MTLKTICIGAYFLLQQQKMGIQPGNRYGRKAESGKTEQYLILKPFSFHQPGSRYQLQKLPNWERQTGT